MLHVSNVDRGASQAANELSRSRGFHKVAYEPVWPSTTESYAAVNSSSYTPVTKNSMSNRISINGFSPELHCRRCRILSLPIT